jgi:two-component system cell cycle sensor histidine kinase/response regulator CckA
VFTRVYGYTSDEVVGQKTPRVLKSGVHSAAEYETLWRTLRSGRTVRRELTNRRKDGTTVLIDTCGNAVVDASGSLTGFLAIQRDITTKRQAEQALHESVALFRRIFDESPVGVAVIGMDGRFARANARLCDILGWSEEELKGRTFLDVTHPDERESSQSAVDDLRSGRIDQIRIEKRYVRKDGKTAWADVSGRVVRKPNGEPICMMPVIIDITERRSLEQQLRQAQKMEAIGQLAGGIAHDFNNILTVMLGYSELLLDDIHGDESLAALRQIQEGGHRAAALIKQLLAFSRTQVLRVEVADLNIILERFHQLVRPIIGEDIDLTFDLAPQPVLVRCDVAQFEQVAMNLIVNARDAMPNGGSIRVRTAIVTVEDGGGEGHDGVVMPSGEYAQLVVQDTGCGMSEEARRRLFEPFFTTKGPGKGTGLGLAVVYGIVKQLGGFIWVYSEVGRGTTFRVYFPRAEQTGAAERPSAVEIAHRAGEERILLVEDNAEARAFAALVLRKHGYDVREAATGTEALEHVEQQKPDLLITDMVMAGMDGAELASRITQTNPDVKVLFTSGYMNHRLVSASDAAFDLLEKPFTATALLNRVRRCIDRKSSPAS